MVNTLASTMIDGKHSYSNDQCLQTKQVFWQNQFLNKSQLIALLICSIYNIEFFLFLE